MNETLKIIIGSPFLMIISSIVILAILFIVGFLLIKSKKIKIPGAEFSLDDEKKEQAASVSTVTSNEQVFSNDEKEIKEDFISFEEKLISDLITSEKTFQEKVRRVFTKAINNAINKINKVTSEMEDTDEDQGELLDLIIEREIRKGFAPVINEIKEKLETNELRETIEKEFNKFSNDIIDTLTKNTNAYPEFSKKMMNEIFRSEKIRTLIFSILEDYVKEYKSADETKNKDREKFTIERDKKLNMTIKNIRNLKK